jgi:hypothetical protein
MTPFRRTRWVEFKGGVEDGDKIDSNRGSAARLASLDERQPIARSR